MITKFDLQHLSQQQDYKLGGALLQSLLGTSGTFTVGCGAGYPKVVNFKVKVPLDLSKWAPYLVSNLRKHIVRYER